MDKDNLFKLYEKLYFHELEVREKINNRIQVTLAILVTFFSIVAYMARMFDLNSNIFVSAIFLLSLTFSCVFIFQAIMTTIDAIKRNLYKGLPSANEIETFKKETEEYESNIKNYNNSSDTFPKVDVEFSTKVEMKEFLYDYFAKWSSYNTEVNDYRSKSIQESTNWLILAVWPLLICSALFIGYDLDASSPRKNLLIEDARLRTVLTELEQTIKKSSTVYLTKSQNSKSDTQN